MLSWAMARPRQLRSRALGRASSFLNPARDGAVLPILHLNGYKISGPTVFGRSDERHSGAHRGNGYEAHFVEGDEPARCTRSSPRRWTLATQKSARSGRPRGGGTRQPRWPAIVLRTPKGWTGPKQLDGLPIEGTFRAHQVPLADVKEEPESWRCWRPGCAATGPEALFDNDGRLKPTGGLAPRGPSDGSQSACERRQAPSGSTYPRFTTTHLTSRGPAPSSTNPPGRLARCCATSSAEQRRRANFRLFCPDETNSNRSASFRGREPLLRRYDNRASTTTSAPTDGSWRC